MIKELINECSRRKKKINFGLVSALKRYSCGMEYNCFDLDKFRGELQIWLGLEIITDIFAFTL